MGYDLHHLRFTKAVRPHLCLLALHWLKPRPERGMPLQSIANLYLLQAEHLILRIMGEADRQQQAVDCYQYGLAAGFYALEQTSAQAVRPWPGSRWSAPQLKRLFDLGQRHGASLHRALYGHRA